MTRALLIAAVALTIVGAAAYSLHTTLWPNKVTDYDQEDGWSSTSSSADSA